MEQKLLLFIMQNNLKSLNFVLLGSMIASYSVYATVIKMNETIIFNLIRCICLSELDYFSDITYGILVFHGYIFYGLKNWLNNRTIDCKWIFRKICRIQIFRYRLIDIDFRYRFTDIDWNIDHILAKGKEMKY